MQTLDVSRSVTPASAQKLPGTPYSSDRAVLRFAWPCPRAKPECRAGHPGLPYLRRLVHEIELRPVGEFEGDHQRHLLMGNHSLDALANGLLELEANLR